MPEVLHVASVLLYEPKEKEHEKLSLCQCSAATTPFFPKRATDRRRDGWMTRNYSSTGILRVNISCKNTPRGQEQKNQQVLQGAMGGRLVGLLYLEPVFPGIISSSDFCTWISICGFSDKVRVEGPPCDVFISTYGLFVKCTAKYKGNREHKGNLNHREGHLFYVKWCLVGKMIIARELIKVL